jgi:hypothetical protein
MFWDVATSDVALATLGLVVVAAFVVAHLTGLVERVWPAAEAYDKAAGLVQIIAAVLLFFLIGFRVSDERAEMRQLKNELAFRQLELQTQRMTAEDADYLRGEAEAAAAKAQGGLDEYRKHYRGTSPATASGALPCGWTDDDLVRLRQLGVCRRRRRTGKACSRR